MSRTHCKSSSSFSAIGLFLDLSGGSKHQGSGFTFTANGAKRLAIETHFKTAGVAGGDNDLFVSPNEALLIGAQGSMAYPSAIGDNRNPGIFLGLDYDKEILLILGWSGS